MPSGDIQMSQTWDWLLVLSVEQSERGMESNRSSMERSAEGRDLGRDPSFQGGHDGGLKKLVLEWFTETQAASLTQDGHFPEWFHGFSTRKDAEDLLEDKAVGVFLIRLSEKAIGYVLSYKGEDRCRHFVISQSQEGQFSIAGDEQNYPSLTALIEHYKVSPIEPFGEFLTHDEQETQEAETELYDSVNLQTKLTSGVSVQALRSLWNQKERLYREMLPRSKSHQLQNKTQQAPALPPKSTRRLTGSVSVDTTELAQHNRAPTNSGIGGKDPPQSSTRTAPLQVTYSSVVHPENRSQSLPCLDNESELSGQAQSKKVTCITYSLFSTPNGAGSGGKQNEDLLKANPLYEPSPGVQEGTQYAQVKEREQKVDSPYEEIDRPERNSNNRSNLYESIEEMKSKNSKSTEGVSKDWKNFFTNYLKK